MAEAAPLRTRRRRRLPWALAAALALPVAGLGGGVLLSKVALSDAQRGACAAALLGGLLPGKFAIGGLGAEFPGRLVFSEVHIHAPHGAEVVAAKTLRARPRWWALLRRQVALDEVQAEAAQVQVRVLALGQGPDIAKIVDADPQQDTTVFAAATPHTPGHWQLLLTRIALAGARLRIQTPEHAVEVQDLRISDGSFSLWSNHLSASFDAVGALAWQTGGRPRLQAVARVHADDLAYQYASNNLRISAHGLQLGLPGLALRLAGSLGANARGPHALDLQAAAYLDSQGAALQQLLPPALQQLLSGSLELRLDAGRADGAYRLDLDLAGPSLALAGLPLTQLQARARVEPTLLRLDRLDVRFPAGWLSLRGWAGLNADSPMPAHALHLAARGLPLQQLARTFVQAPDQLPQRLDLSLNSQTEGSWPAHTLLDLRATATGLPISRDLEAIREPLIAQGRASLSWQRLVIVDRLRLGDQSHQFGLSGSIPLDAPGKLDLIQGLHWHR